MTLSFVHNIIVHGLYCLTLFTCKREEVILGKALLPLASRPRKCPAASGQMPGPPWALAPTGYHGMLTGSLQPVFY